MSVVINTNYAATVASNNLAAASALLQKSLNRLSSGSKIVSPADDAGGLAVSMKLSAAAKRQGAVSSNVANAISLLQAEDGVLAATGKILNRISELKVLYTDVTKSASDKANYQAEFVALVAQITANGHEKFNGVSLFGSTGLSVGTTENGTGSITTQPANLLGTAAWAIVGGVTPGADWTANAGIANAGGYTRFHGNGTLGTVQGNIAGPFTMTFSFNLVHNGGGSATLDMSGGSSSLDLHALVSPYDAADHRVAVAVDDSGNATWSMDGGVQAGALAGFSPVGGGHIEFTTVGFPTSDLHLKDDFTLLRSGGTGNIADVLAASGLGTLNLSTISSAIQETATYRAQNGATQSQLGFSAELLSVNKANLEAATSRITDVDVAAESTILARSNILVQAGASMLAQANQSSQLALKLIG